MAELRRNSIELVKNPKEIEKGGEPEFEKYWTPMFIDLGVLYEAVDIHGDILKFRGGAKQEKELIDKMISFVADKIYGGQFTSEQLRRSLHAPTAMENLQEQIIFVARGQQNESTKKFLAKKN